jgi:hypothetical protein
MTDKNILNRERIDDARPTQGIGRGFGQLGVPHPDAEQRIAFEQARVEREMKELGIWDKYQLQLKRGNWKKK